MSPALESNAGDRYHFVLAARRVLDMLHPSTRLHRVVLEGVAPEDTGTDEEAYLGVDLALYFGGETLETAEALTITQIKYSPTHPTKVWTLARLAARRHANKPGSSILGKLGAAFLALYERAPAIQYHVEIVTNQPLADEDARAYERLRDAIQRSTLSGVTPADRAWFDSFKAATQLEGASFDAFFAAFDVGGFGSPLLSRAESGLAADLATFVSNDLHVGDLIAFIQDHATLNRPTDIDRSDVLRQLRLFEEDFMPAPALLEAPASLFATVDAAAVAKVVRETASGIVLVHGIAGRGKTSIVQLLAREYAEALEVVVYDCFGSGVGMQAGHERFPYAAFFTQVINDLDATLHTNVFATTKIEYGALARRFESALDAGAKRAGMRGKKVVIAIDAIDNAAIAAAESTLRGAESFIPLLSKVRIPENVVVLCTTRSENVARVPLTPDISIELQGFTREETRHHASLRVPSMSDADADLLHEATNGTARVQARILESLATATGLDVATYIRERAKASAFEYYEHEAPNRLRATADRSALALLVEATQPITVELWAKLTGREETDLALLRSSLAFGLRHEPAGIEWRDQEFWDFVREFLSRDLPAARTRLADFCVTHVDAHAYARTNFSRHLYEDQRFDALVDHWLTGGRIEEEIRLRTAQDDVVRDDLAYAVLAAQQRRRRTEVLQLLTIAADVTQGRSVFFEAIAKVPTAAVGEGIDEGVLSWLQDAEQTPSVARAYLAFAAAVEDPQHAWDLRERGVAILRNEKRRGTYEGGFRREDIEQIAAADARFDSLANAVALLGQWSPARVIAPVYANVIVRHLTLENAQAVVDTVREIEDAACRGYAALALLACVDRLPKGGNLQQFAEWALGSPTAEREYPPLSKPIALDAIEALLHANHHDLACRLLSLAESPAPRFWHEPAHEFLRFVALREKLMGEAFDPKTFRESKSSGYDAERERVRGILSRAYPAALLRVQAAAGECDLERGIAAVQQLYGEKTYRREAPRLDVKIAAQEILRALTYLPVRCAPVAGAVRAMVEKELPNPAQREYGRLASVLAMDARYHREAEDLFRAMVAAERPPNIRATEAVDVLLYAYDDARRVDSALASRVVEAARALADGVDATIDARTVVLLGTYRAMVADDVVPTPEQTHHLAALVEYQGDVGEDGLVRRMEDALTLIGRVSPGAAVDLALEWDDLAKLHLLLALLPVAVGIGERADTPAALLASVASFGSNAGAVSTFLQALSTSTLDADDRRRFVAGWAEYVRRMAGTARFWHAGALLAFAAENAVLDVPQVVQVGADLEAAGTAGIPSRNRDDHVSLRWQSDEGLDVVEALIATSPSDALARFEELGPTVLHGGARTDAVIAALASSLSTARCRRILVVIERWAGDAAYRVIEALPLIATVARSCETVALDARSAASRLLGHPGALVVLPGDYDHSAVHALHSLWSGSYEALFDIVAEGIAKNLEVFGTGPVFRWIAELVHLRDGKTAASYFDFASPRAFARIPSPRPGLAVCTDDGRTALVRLLGAVLAHPRMEYRFRAVYAVVEVILADAEFMVPAFVDVVRDETHPRWMTRREWALFAFQHVAFRRPDVLADRLEPFVAVALNRAFPHANHRAQAREVVLRVAATYPAALSAETLASVRLAQQPTKFMKEDFNTRSDPRSENWYDKPFHFDWTDTIRYSYEPLGRVFNLSGVAIADRAMRWIVDAWGITHERCTAESDADKHDYDWHETRNDKGSAPAVETLESYAERHGMFVVAGELVDSLAIVRDRREVFDEWTDWIRTDAREADPSLPSLLLGPPPFEPENYGVFATAFEEWRVNRAETEYTRHITTSDSFVLVAEMEGASRQYDFDISVRTIFVCHDTAKAFIRTIRGAKERFCAQAQSLHYTTIVPEIEEDMRRFRKAYGTDVVDDEGGSGAFELRATLGDLHQEFDFHRADPRWRSFSRHYPYPSSVVQEALGLSRPDPLRLDWATADGQIVIRTEMWHDGRAGDDVDGASGYRMLLKKDQLARLIETTGKDVAFIVTLRRQSTYRYRQEGAKHEYDPGTMFAVLGSTLISQ